MFLRDVAAVTDFSVPSTSVYSGHVYSANCFAKLILHQSYCFYFSVLRKSVFCVTGEYLCQVIFFFNSLDVLTIYKAFWNRFENKRIKVKMFCVLRCADREVLLNTGKTNYCLLHRGSKKAA